MKRWSSPEKKMLIASCGLFCGTCAFYRESEIMKTALRLKEMRKGFEGIAERDSDFAKIWLRCNKKMKKIDLDKYLKNKKEPRYKNWGG